MSRFELSVIALLLIAVALVGAEKWGEHSVQVEWDKERARQEAVAAEEKKTDAAARKATEEQHRKDIEHATSQAGRAALNRWLHDHGLLPDGTPLHIPCGGETESPESPDGAGGELGPGGSIEEFALRCARDAITIGSWQDWAKREGLESE